MAVLSNASGLAVKTSESDSGHGFSDFLQVMVLAGIYMVCIIVLLSYIIHVSFLRHAGHTWKTSLWIALTTFTKTIPQPPSQGDGPLSRDLPSTSPPSKPYTPYAVDAQGVGALGDEEGSATDLPSYTGLVRGAPPKYRDDVEGTST